MDKESIKIIKTKKIIKIIETKNYRNKKKIYENKTL